MKKLFDLLVEFQDDGVFNQYRDAADDLDRPDGAAIRRANLRRYLERFSGAAYVLVGEAAGYAGCRFSGIPFTGEAQLVGPECLPWACDAGLARSSAGGEPWRERSGTMVWQALGDRRDCVLWNAFPWHPFDPAQGGAFDDERLSNRRPRRGEMRQAHGVLRHFLSLFPRAEVLAIGRVSQRALREIGLEMPYIRHPSHGGKTAFTQGLEALPRVR
jgi:hypothetical protein